MVKRSADCDPNRLRSYLDDDLSAGDQAELAGHLDHCGDLPGGAGAARRREPALGRPARPRAATDGRCRASGRRPSGEGRPAAAARGVELDFLAPSEDPASLGRLGPYEIIGVLGQGGMGVVLKAFDPALSRVVAIKVLAPQLAASGAARRRFSREAKAAAAVVHDHVVAIHAVDDDPKRAAVPGDAVHRRPIAPGADRPRRPAAHRGGPAHRHADRAGAGRGARPGAGPPRHQAGEHPAGERRRAGQDHRLRPGPRHRRRQPVAERRRRRHAAVHVARAGRRRVGRPPVRPVQPGQRAVRHVRRAFAVPRQDHDGRPAARLRRGAPAAGRDQPRGARVAGGRDRPAARQGPGRAIPVGRGGRRGAGPAARRAAAAGRRRRVRRPAPRRRRPSPSRRSPGREARRPRSTIGRSRSKPRARGRRRRGRDRPARRLRPGGRPRWPCHSRRARDAGPPWIDVAVAPQAGQGQPPANVVITRRIRTSRRRSSARASRRRRAWTSPTSSAVEIASPVPRRGDPGGSLRRVASPPTTTSSITSRSPRRARGSGSAWRTTGATACGATRSRWRSPCRPWRRST